MARKGKCYKPDTIVPEHKLRKNPSSFAKLKAYLSTLTMREIWYSLGVKVIQPEVKIKAIDLKINAILMPEANRYRIYDYRFVSCPGELLARVLDSNGDPIPGQNEVRILLYH
jgi:hypothetical protein